MRYLVDDGRTGLLSPVGDSAGLAANVLKVLQEPQLAQLLAKNALLELDRYRWESVRELWLGIYCQLVPEAKSVSQSVASN
jgi:glycosyltransferase involved in cell wall biosynthesis